MSEQAADDDMIEVKVELTYKKGGRFDLVFRDIKPEEMGSLLAHIRDPEFEEMLYDQFKAAIAQKRAEKEAADGQAQEP